jgi:hypothetical protein
MPPHETAAFTKQGESRLRHIAGQRLLLPDKGSRASAGRLCTPRGQSRSSGTAPGAPDRRDRRVAVALVRCGPARKRKRSRRLVARMARAGEPRRGRGGDRIHAKALATRSPAAGGSRQFCLGSLHRCGTIPRPPQLRECGSLARSERGGKFHMFGGVVDAAGYRSKGEQLLRSERTSAFASSPPNSNVVLHRGPLVPRGAFRCGNAARRSFEGLLAERRRVWWVGSVTRPGCQRSCTPRRSQNVEWR